MASFLFTELFVNNLPPATSDEELRVKFSLYGEVESIWVTQKHPVAAFGVVRCGAGAGRTDLHAARGRALKALTGPPRPCRFATHAEAEKAKAALNRSEYNGRLIGVKW